MTAVSRETRAKLDAFAALVRAENAVQNLVSPTTLDEFETRHIADSLQLAAFGSASGSWCDVGSGAGIPGVILAIVTGAPTTLIEPRKLRADFLRRVVADLNLQRVDVCAAKAERCGGQFDFITARAVAETGKLFAIAEHLTHPGTRWILPKGDRAQKELEAAQQAWQGSFSLVPSTTREGSMIVLAEHVRRKGGR